MHRDIRVGLSVLLLASCGPPPLTFGLHRHASGSDLALVGTASEEQLFVNTPGGAARQLVLPSKARCSVTAPSGAAVDCTVSDWERPSIDEDNGVARLRFVPSEVGAHEVKATLDEGDQETWLVHAYTQRATVVARLERACRWVERLRGGGWLCDDVFLRDGEPAQALGAQLTSAEGDFVWAYASGKVRRFRDDGAGPLTAEAPLDLGGLAPTRLFATERDAVLLHATGFELAQVQPSGAIALTAGLARSLGAGAIVRRVGSTVLIGEPLGQETNVCVISIASASLVEGGCRRYAGALVGEADSGGLLLAKGLVVRVVNARLDDGLTLELPDPLSLTVPDKAERGFKLLIGGMIPRVSGDVLVLESYPGASLASEQFAWTPGLVTPVMSR